MENSSSLNVAVVISSCDAYSDIWPFFFKLFYKYWGDCPFDIHLISNHYSIEDESIFIHNSGPDKGWSMNLMCFLEKNNHYKYLIYLQEDYFLINNVDNQLVFKILNYIKDNNIGYCRLFPSPEPDEMLSEDLGLGLIHKGSKYRVSLQASIWNINTLQAVLKVNETGWDMEILGSERSSCINDLFTSISGKKYISEMHLPIPYLATAIVKGKWKKRVVNLAKKENLNIDFSNRGFYTKPIFLLKLLKVYYFLKAKKYK